MDKENLISDDVMLSTELQCPVVMETLNPNGGVGKRSCYKKANVSLARNVFRDVVLVVVGERESVNHVVTNVVLHTKFIKEGKATVVIDNRVRCLISNCAVDKLILFLKTLSCKVGKKSHPQQNKLNNREDARKRLLTEKKRAFTEISPLTNNEMNSLASSKRAKVETTPTGTKKIRLTDSQQLTKRRLDVSRPLPVSNLTDEQKLVLSAVLSGKNVFFTGSAGTGKSYLLKKLIRILPPETTFVTASTGVAAMHIGGVTLHSFAGIGTGSANLENALTKIKASNVGQQWKKCQHLVVDEISMIQGDYFAKLEQIARAVRRNDRPFGGIQLIVCGDFLQLPPVAKANEKRTFCFETEAWEKCLAVNLELSVVHRQRDQKLISILQAIRMGVCTIEMAETLLATRRNNVEQDGILATHLCTHNNDVSSINLEQLRNLPGEAHTFNAVDSERCLSSWLDKQCPVESVLTLKLGTQVMLLKNYDFQQGLVNGSRGIVVKFDEQSGLPVVKFKCGPVVTVAQHQWTVRANGTEQVSRKQLPLKLAWALSIHKAQGMTLDCVEMSLSKVFECGQAYVGLSRASKLNGLRVLDFDRRCVRADPKVIDFYKCLKSNGKRIT